MIEKPVGRPALADNQKRKTRSIKMSDQEWEEMQRKAHEEGISVAELIRNKTLGAD